MARPVPHLGQAPLAVADTQTAIIIPLLSATSTAFATSSFTSSPTHKHDHTPSPCFDFASSINNPSHALFATGSERLPSLTTSISTASQSAPTHAPVAIKATTVGEQKASSNHNELVDPSMQRPGRKCFGGFLALSICYIALGWGGVQLNKATPPEQLYENEAWIASGESWLDRQVCRWVGICGSGHFFKRKEWRVGTMGAAKGAAGQDTSHFWVSESSDMDNLSEEEKRQREIPQYVLDHAPYVHLFSGEDFWPCDIADHLTHTSPHVNYTTIEEMQDNRNLTNLGDLNNYEEGKHGRYIYLQSDDNVEERPDWLGGESNIPDILDVGGWSEHSVPWPGLDDLRDFDLTSAKQQALAEHGDIDPQNFPTDSPRPNLEPSTDGTCGGSSGYTCKGSKFGKCCSIYGHCGSGDAHCGAACDPLSGKCNKPFHPSQLPRTELRKLKRRQHLTSKDHAPPAGGHSTAPAILIIVPKEDGIVDAFWFFFYSYNLGNQVLNVRFGNHVGDWEHTVIRFQHGHPQLVFLSEHNFGEAYTWHAMEKYLPSPSGQLLSSHTNATAARLAKRPTIYSATGTHAMYGTPGLHPYVLPWGLLHDQTDRGPLWDPLLNQKSYIYNLSTRALYPSTLNPDAPTSWFDYAGHWGDKYYPLSDPRQYRFWGQYHYVNGPTGPRGKNLGREKICQGKGRCRIKDWLGERGEENGGSGVGLAPPEEDLEEGGLPGGNVTDGVE